MRRAEKLLDEAGRLMKAGQFRDACLLFRQSSSTAAEIGDSVDWYKGLVWAGHVLLEQGESRSALRLLLEARQEEPENAPVREAWILRKQFFELLAEVRPSLGELQSTLEKLESYARPGTFRPGLARATWGFVQTSRGLGGSVESL